MGKQYNMIVDTLLETGRVNFTELSGVDLVGVQRCLASRSDRLAGSHACREELTNLNKWSLLFKDEITARANPQLTSSESAPEPLPTNSDETLPEPQEIDNGIPSEPTEEEWPDTGDLGGFAPPRPAPLRQPSSLAA